MLCMEINKTPIVYKLYTGKTEAVDDDGMYTGEQVPTYADPVTIRASVSAARGMADLELFGVDVVYSNTIIVDDMTCPIDENSLIEIGGDPYAVVRVAKSLNHITYAVQKLNAFVPVALKPVSG